jgi:Family of unknown function (DUF5856)
MKEDILITLLQIQNQVRILHWQTTSYGRHKAYGKVYEKLDELIDEFVETCMGKHGRFEFGKEANIQLFNLKALEINSFLSTATEFLMGFNKEFKPEEDSDLLNIRDTILGEINKLKYLLTLK